MSVRRSPQRLWVPASSSSIVAGTAISAASASTWYEAISSTTEPIYIFAYGAAGTGTYDIGTGAASSESAVLTLPATTISSSVGLESDRLLPVPIYVPASTRVAVRGTTTMAPIGIQWATLTGVGYRRGYVSAATSGTTSTPTAVNTSTWTTLVASASADIWITHIHNANSTATAGLVQIATGAAGSEVQIAAPYGAPVYNLGLSGVATVALRWPIRVPSGTRLSAKGYGSVSLAYVYEASVVQ